MSTFQFIDSQHNLSQVITQLTDASEVFLDTEFIKRNTYYPILGLLQINLGDAENSSYVIDAVSLDLMALWQALLTADLWVMHACSEDIDLIAQQAKTDVLPPIFDTQIGLSFLGKEVDAGLQTSYQDALDKLLDVQIDKGESCSDWLARPLRDEQLTYAANDVVYLPALYHKIKTELDKKSLYDLALEDAQSLKTDVLHTLPMDELYKEWADFRYKPKQLAQLQALCAWREGVAINKNIPRTFVIKKSSLRDIIQKQPKNKKELAAINDFRPANVREYGDVILAKLADLPEEDSYPQRTLRPFKEPKELGLTAAIKEKINMIAAENHMPADVLMRKRWLTKLYQHVALCENDDTINSTINDTDLAKTDKHRLPAYLTGWRWDVVTVPVLEILAVHATLLRQHIVPREQW